jgi:subtilisin family serine protease
VDPVLQELLRRGADADEIAAVIRFTEESAPPPPGVRLVARFGPIATCRLKLGDVPEVRADTFVANLKASRLLGPDEMPAATEEWFETPTDARRPPGLRPTGCGVVVGILDWGLDLVSPTFRRPDGTTRLMALWDQRAHAGRQQPNLYEYGTIYNSMAINAALRSPDPYGALNYHPADADPYGIGTHGTVVADLAAGNGLSGGPIGVAPEASLVFVHLATAGTTGLANLGDSIGILEGLDFVRRIAGRRPLAVSLSVGRHGGPHDGCTLVERAFDAFLSSGPGLALSQSSGNYRLKQTHASGMLMPGTIRRLRLIVDAPDPSVNELEIWHDTDPCAVCLDAPDGTTSGWIPLGASGEIGRAGRLIARVYHRRRDPQNDSHHLDAFIYPGAPAGEWTVGLRDDRASGNPEEFHAWIERDDACATCQSKFVMDDADPACTLGTLANGDRPITCGAFDAHDPVRAAAAFASGGPTRDGRGKPDLGAPGVGVLAVRSQSRGRGRSEPFTRKSGTSMSAPQVAGCTALLLETAAGRLWNDDVKDLLVSTVDPAPTGDRRLGAGYLNIERAVASAQRHARRWEFGRGGFVEVRAPRAAASDDAIGRGEQTSDDETPSAIPTLGFEFDVHYGLVREVVADAGKTMPPDGDQVMDHSESSDGFRVKLDGPRFEIATKPFTVDDAGRKDLAHTTDNILQFAGELKDRCAHAASRDIAVIGLSGQRVSGSPRPFTHPKTRVPGLPIVRLYVADSFHPSNCSVWASPQATLTIPLAKVAALASAIKKSEGDPAGTGLTGDASARMGLRSEALYRATTAVSRLRQDLVDRRPRRTLSDGTEVDATTFTETLRGFLILLAMYLWTGELPYNFTGPPPRDYEPFAKAYLPVNVKAPFSEIFRTLLSSAEQRLFREVFTGSARDRLFKLAKPAATLADGSRKLFPAGPKELGFDSVHRRQQVEFGSVPTWDDLVEHTLDSTHNGWGDRLLVPLSKPIGVDVTAPRVALELRRIGFNVVFAHQWNALMQQIFAMTKRLNA